MPHRRRLVVGFVIAGFLAFCSWAVGDTGDLTPKNCVDDNDNGVDTCRYSVDGLMGVEDVAVSADGNSVYAVSFSDNAIVAFDRGPNGGLAPLGCIDDNDTGTDTCAQSTDGLGGASGVAVSPDGKSVYVSSYGDDAVARFNRDTTTGELTAAGCVDDNDTGPDTCAQSADGLDGPTDIAISTNNNSVYVGSLTDNAVVRLNRNTSTGALTPAGCIDDNDTGPDTCAQSADGLAGIEGVTVSADRKSVFAASYSDQSLAILKRNASSGAITPVGCIDAGTGPDICAQSTDGLGGASAVAVSADGKSVYVAGDALVRFNRDTSTLALTPKGCIGDNDLPLGNCITGTDGVGSNAYDVAVSADGKSVYLAGGDDSVVQFERTARGALAPAGCIDDNDTGLDTCEQTTDGLDDTVSVAVSADGRSVYAGSLSDAAVVRFNRQL